ncbi:MAG: IS66 family transposase [Sandaracinaceae bacterium]|nr:IS66 family transposase [Sandaracinaceae bacterium]MBK8406617.1 IS66 family transposase [Sandaracinaceae bacterium]
MTDLAGLIERLDELQRGQDAIRRALQQAESERERAREERDRFKALYLEMLERNRKLERGLMGQQRERATSESQLTLDVLSAMLGERAAADIDALQGPEEPEEKKPRKKGHGRKPLPEDLPRVDIEIIPDEVQRAGLDAFERISEEVTEVLERRPGSMVIARIIKPKFVRKDREPNAPTEVHVGQTPSLPIPRSVAGPGLLADTLVRRWQDHMPLHRLEQMYAREGVEMARSTICGWHEQLRPLVEPLIAAMRAEAFTAPYLCTDATGVLVQAKEQCRRGHFWVLIDPGRHVLFEYTRNHTNDAVDSLLAGYEGYLVADAHVVYDHLYERGDIVEVNCWAHSRRYFFKAMASDPERAGQALRMQGLLFKIERSIKDAPRKKREAIRQKHSAPVVERFFSWCDAEWERALEDTPMYAALRYARNQRVGLQRFLADGRLPLENNISERELRRQAVGRKNWLFVGSDDAAHVNAAFTTLLASCRMVGVEPWEYLRDLFCLLPAWPAHRVLELAPAYWAGTREREDVVAMLAADPYRAATL